MIKDKKDIQAMINKYLTDERGINALGFISYHTFDKELIAEDYESINDFFRGNFNLYHSFIHYQDLLEDESGKTWLKINTIFDLKLLDELIAFGIVSKVFNENILFRFHEAANFDFILNEDPDNLVNFKEEENYIRLMKNRVIPKSTLEVSEETIRHYENVTLNGDYSIERKKELLISWWDQGTIGIDDKETRDTFLQLLESEYVYNLIDLVWYIESHDGSTYNLAEFIKRGKILEALNYVDSLYNNSSPKNREVIKKGLQEMFDKFNEMDQKKKRLS